MNLEFSYFRKARVSPGAFALFSGKSMDTQFGEGYYYTTPRNSSLSGQFAWVNNTVLISIGKLRLDESGQVKICMVQDSQIRLIFRLMENWTNNEKSL